MSALTRRNISGLNPRYLSDPDFVSGIGPLLRSGKLRWHQKVMAGLDALPSALALRVRGESRGKLRVRLD